MFSELVKDVDITQYLSLINSSQITTTIISNVLSKETINFHEFLLLLSNEAKPFIPQMVNKSKLLKKKYFGNTVQIYMPIYLSNECVNGCLYCSFNASSSIVRKTLSFQELEKEFIYIKALGIDSVLLLTGESPKSAGVDYISECIKIANNYFSYVSLEIHPCSKNDYSSLINAGASGLTLYQETYNKILYTKLHPYGPKKDYSFRLSALEHAMVAGFRKIGVGALLGLNNWREDIVMLALHIKYIQKKFWKSDITISFPRIKNYLPFLYPVSDSDFIQMILALRLLFPTVGITLSTREAAPLRDYLLDVCITQLSVASKTNPGGYSHAQSTEQFAVFDDRNMSDILIMLSKKDIDPITKDWSSVFKEIKNEN